MDLDGLANGLTLGELSIMITKLRCFSFQSNLTEVVKDVITSKESLHVREVSAIYQLSLDRGRRDSRSMVFTSENHRPAYNLVALRKLRYHVLLS